MTDRNALQAIVYPAGSTFRNTVSNLRGLKVSTASPGGCFRASWMIDSDPPYLGLANIQENYVVDIVDSGGLVWRGRVDDIETTIRNNKATISYTALGYAEELSDTYYELDRRFFANTPIEGVVRQVRTDMLPDISTSDRLIITTGRAINLSTNGYLGKTGRQVFDDLLKLGDVNNHLLTWHIWAGDPQIGGKPELELRTKATVSSYYVSVAEGTMPQVRSSRRDHASRILVLYGSGLGGFVTAVNPTTELPYPGGDSFKRTLKVELSNVTSAIDAQNVANTLLNEVKLGRARGGSIQVPAGTPIRNNQGAIVMPWLLPAGEIITVRELEQGGEISRESQFYMQQVEYDDTTGNVTVTPEGPDDLTTIAARLLRR